MAESLRTIEWKDGMVTMIDQTKLPGELVHITCRRYEEVADAIKRLAIRGAPAIGVAGAFGMALACNGSSAINRDEFLSELEKAKNILNATRPTAVNLRWGLERIMKSARRDGDVAKIKDAVISEALKMAQEDVKTNIEMGRHGARLIKNDSTIMTHCNAGALATVAYGTALGVIRAVKEDGKDIKVIATETRPVQQGSRLTAFELDHDGIDVSLIPDTAVGYTMAQRMVDGVIVGADRILRTGHVYNKIGTYQVAVMARRHGIPFYVAAPLSTFDMENTPEGVIIEQRGPDELTGSGSGRTAPKGVPVINPAFDLTPPELISCIITEKGIAREPYIQSIKELIKAN